MTKILLICILVGYVLYKLGSSVRIHTNTHSNQGPRQHRPPGSNVNIVTPPASKKSKDNDFKGGEYVDYEEVK
jgi:hypothetical protein